MIDPEKISNFNLSDEELEEQILFWILVAGKNAKKISEALEKILLEIDGKRNKSPFESFRSYRGNLQYLLKRNGIGCHSLKSRGIKYIINSDLNLRNCEVEDLEKVPGIGRKTSRAFVLHTRRNSKVAALDTHILKFLRSKGIKSPLSTPSSKKKYLELEKKFLELVPKNKGVAEFDLEIWKRYSREPNKK